MSTWSELVFPTFLLPPLQLPFHRTQPPPPPPPPLVTDNLCAVEPPSTSSLPHSSGAEPLAPSSPAASPASPASPAPPVSPASPASPASTASTACSESASPATPGPVLARVYPNTLRCATCSVDLSLASQIVSKGFTGRMGRAYLVAAPSVPYGATTSGPQSDLLNIRVGRPDSRQLATGWHVVADISCVMCASHLGWKYIDASDPSQRYKVGKFILEVERVAHFLSWEDVVDSGQEEPVMLAATAAAAGAADIEFDSQDEDECDDVFAGTWDPASVAARRAKRTSDKRWPWKS